MQQELSQVGKDASLPEKLPDATPTPTATTQPQSLQQQPQQLATEQQQQQAGAAGHLPSEAFPQSATADVSAKGSAAGSEEDPTAKDGFHSVYAYAQAKLPAVHVADLWQK
jgi:hypothetical protein